MNFRIDRPFTLHFVRHGVTDLNFRGLRCGGDVDVPLTGMGCDQAFLLGKQIARMELDIGRIITSSLIRTRQTALLVSGVLGALPIEFDPLLNERSLGEWNGRPIAETEQALREGVTPPGGESEEIFSARVLQALENLRHRLDERLLIVSSRGVGRVLNTLLGGDGRLAVSNGEVIEFSAQMGPQGGYTLQVNRPLQVG